MLNFQFCAAISVIPSARLLETSPKGWQSTGSYEDKNYTKLQQSIQEEDFCPILNFHYQLLTKSKYDKIYDFDCIFNDIDTPTEKERAEIREINSRTDSNYINAGVISPDEVGDVLRQDPNSGYSALSEDMPDDELNLDDEEENNGGSSNEQDPFSLDNDFKESDHPRDKDGKFSNGSGSKNSLEKSSKYDKVKNRQRKSIQLSKEEYAKVMHELNTNLTKEQRKKKQISKAIGDYIYTVRNSGFNEYKILKKQELNDFYN